MSPSPLPIWQIHSAIVGHLQTGNRLVLVAPTGSGKTTQVPQMLLEAGLSGRKKIVVLQPRRVAARTVAARVAWERQSKLGGEVGYQIRFDDQTSLGTRICFVTEGIVLRWLQDDRRLSDIGALLFDEFHERNLLSDVALALVKQLQQSQRPDLKIIVMSATLEAEPVADYLNTPGQQAERVQLGARSHGPDNAAVSPNDASPCPILASEGQLFPVQVRYLAKQDERPISEQAADAVQEIVNAGEFGDILVFMPGMGEINATMNACRALRADERLALIPLHGELEPEQQDVAFAPNPLRKVIVATNVAETSVTIDGVRHVVDSGLARIARYDSERGISTLFIEEISRASAEQRKGRAGRTAPGTCHRLWTESGHLNRPERNTPEIQRTDLAEVVLLLHSLGIQMAADFDWLDKPDPAAIERAESLLRMLGALELADQDGERLEGRSVAKIVNGPAAVRPPDLTAIGRQMLYLPMHPRYSRMLVEAARRNCVPAAALCAALVGGRDLLQRLRREDKHIAETREVFEASQDSDFFTLMEAYRFAQQNNFSVEQCRRYGVNAHVARQVEQTYEQILDLAKKQRLFQNADSIEKRVPAVRETRSKIRPGETASHAAASLSEEALLRCLLAGFIDQLCKRRDQGTLECELIQGRQGTLMRESVVSQNGHASLFVAALIREVASKGPEQLTLLGLASAVKREWLEDMFPEHLTTRLEHIFDRAHKRVAALKLVKFHDLIIHSEYQRDVDALASGRCLAEAYGKKWFELPLFNHELKQFIARVNLVALIFPELEFSPLNDLAITTCLGRAFRGLTLLKEAQGKALKDEFVKHLALGQLGWLDELAPTVMPWSDSRKVKLIYPEAARDENSEPNSPEAQVKLHECFQIKEHPRICEGKLPVKLWLCAPDGKRLESTLNWPAFRTNTYPKLKHVLQKKYPGMAWI